MNKKGYKGASLQDISDRVGIHKSSLFHYFKNKEEILLAVLESAIWIATDFIEQIVDDKSLSPEEKLKKVISGHINWIVKYIDHVNVYHSEIRYLSLKNRKKYMNSRKQYESCFIKIINEVRKKDKKNFSGVETKIAAFGILGMGNWVIKWYKQSGPRKPEEIADIFYRLIAEKMID